MKTKSSHLAEWQERLIMAFCDEECGVVGKWLAKRLLARSPEARDFLRSVRDSSIKIGQTLVQDREIQENALGKSLDLWNQVNSRISEEERLECLLGRRNKVSVRERNFSFPNMLSYLEVGGVGALVAAATLLFVFRVDSKELPLSETSKMAATNSNLDNGQNVLEPAKYETGQGDSGENLFEDKGEPFYSLMPQRASKLARALEVDWMRSHGRVKVIQHPGENSAIFWVSRNQANNLENMNRLWPVGMGSSSSDSFSSSSGEPVRILEDNVPSAITVMDR